MTSKCLLELSPVPLQIVWHENRRTYLSIRKSGGVLFLRLHRLFMKAPKPVLEALIQMALKKDTAARTIVRHEAHRYFSENRIVPKPIPSQGKVYDLEEILKRMQEKYFNLPVCPTIGWSLAKTGRFRHITFGTYDKHQNQIRINSLLDDVEVPLYFVEFIVYHEMLHAVCRSQMHPSGRCSVHTSEFRRLEKLFPQYEMAKAWEKNSLQFFKLKHRKTKRI